MIHLEKIKTLMTRKNAVNVVHWISVGSACAAAVVTGFDLPPSQKITGIMTTGALLAFNQILHKFSDSLDHQATLTESLVATLPLIHAATAGNEVQTEAVTAATQALPHPAIAVVEPVVVAVEKKVIKEGSVLL